MELAEPVESVRDEEIPNLVPPVVEDERAPVWMRASAWILVLVEGGAVEAGEREVVAREVRGHPVEDHAEAVLMEPVDEGTEVVRRTEPRRRREVPGDLVAPRSAEWMLHHRHQLDVREAEVGGVGGELVGELEVGERSVLLERVSPPRAEMHLVDRHRAVERTPAAARLEPLRVAPLVARARDDRGRRRRHLGGERHRIGLQAEPTVGSPDLVLVLRLVGHPRDEQLPDPGRAERAHLAEPAVPSVEVTDDAHRLGRRSPDREGHALDLRHGPRMGAELRVQLLVASLGDEVEVELAERRQERVRVVDDEGRAAGEADLERIAKRHRPALEHGLEQAGRMDPRELDSIASVGSNRHRDGVGPKRPDDDTPVGRVGPEDVMRIRVVARDDPLDLGARRRRPSDPWTRHQTSARRTCACRLPGSSRT